jgi:mycoredoxin
VLAGLHGAREAGSPEPGSAAVDVTPTDSVIFYWRPGCGFCASLRRRLRRSGSATQEINIWNDPAGAAFVRSVARGNETVPTVVVGRHALVNPAARDVLDLVRRDAPYLLPDPVPARQRRRLFGRRNQTS